MREELHEYMLAMVLTAVLLWYTYVSIPHSHSRAWRRPLPDAEERGGGRGEASEGAAELDWPEYLEEV